MSTPPTTRPRSPIDVAVIIFDDGVVGSDVAPAVADLHESGHVRVLDMAIVRVDAGDAGGGGTAGDAGAAVVEEIEEGSYAAAFARIDPAEEFDLLSKEDLEEIAVQLEPGSAALVVVWENTWVDRLAETVRAASGRLATWHRVPPEDVERALRSATEEGDRS